MGRVKSDPFYDVFAKYRIADKLQSAEVALARAVNGQLQSTVV